MCPISVVRRVAETPGVCKIMRPYPHHLEKCSMFHASTVVHDDICAPGLRICRVISSVTHVQRMIYMIACTIRNGAGCMNWIPLTLHLCRPWLLLWLPRRPLPVSTLYVSTLQLNNEPCRRQYSLSRSFEHRERA